MASYASESSPFIDQSVLTTSNKRHRRIAIMPVQTAYRELRSAPVADLRPEATISMGLPEAPERDELDAYEIRAGGGDYAFVLAAQAGDIGAVDKMLQAGVNVNAAAAWPITALELATQNGHAEVVRLLISARADVNVRAIGRWTPLMKAGARGYGDITRLLIAAGADVNAVNKNGDTALILASRNGHARVVHILLKSGANPSIENRCGETALHYAIQAQNKLIRDLIREASRQR